MSGVVKSHQPGPGSYRTATGPAARRRRLRGPGGQGPCGPPGIRRQRRRPRRQGARCLRRRRQGCGSVPSYSFVSPARAPAPAISNATRLLLACVRALVPTAENKKEAAAPAAAAAAPVSASAQLKALNEQARPHLLCRSLTPPLHKKTTVYATGNANLSHHQ